MELQSNIHNGIDIITVNAGRIDAAAAIQFKDAMRAAMDQGPDRFILDLSQVTFVDSSGLGAIVASLKQMGAGRRFDLAGLTPDVDKVFRLTRMDTVFDIYADTDAATVRATG